MTLTHTLQSSRAAAPVLVNAIPAAPGLVVHYQSEDLLKDPVYQWRLGHHSGFALGKFATWGDALDAAEAIAGFTDWTRPADDIRADSTLNRQQLRDLINGTPGLFMHSQPIN